MRIRLRPFLPLMLFLAFIEAGVLTGACGSESFAPAPPPDPSDAGTDTVEPPSSDGSDGPDGSDVADGSDGTDAGDGGSTRAWSGIVSLENGDGNVVSYAVAMSKNGDAMVVFAQEAVRADGGIERDIWAARYVGSTQTWATPVLIENAPRMATSPDVAMDDSGNATAVWVQDDGTNLVLWAARFTVAGGWTAPEKIVTADGKGAGTPRVAMYGNGSAVVVWRESDGTRGNIWGARYTSTGWHPAQRLELSDELADRAAIAVNASGIGMAIWRQRVGPNYRLFGNRFNPTSGFASALPIETNASNEVEQNFDVAVDEVGNALAVFSYSPEQTVFANVYSVASGAWATPELLGSGSAANQSSPKVAMNAAGHAMVVWRRVAEPKVSTRRYTPGSGWGPVVEIEPTTGVSAFPKVGIDADGNAFAIWQQTETEPTSRYVLVSRNSGTSWDPPIRFDAPTGGNASTPTIAVNPSGNAVAVWTQSDGTRNSLWANVYR